MTVDERLRRRRERHRRRPMVVRLLAAAGGVLAVLGGLAMLVLPGPGIAALAVGLGLLALEFEWAERVLGYVVHKAERVTPERRRHRAALAGATVTTAVAAIVIGAVWGIPGF